MLFYFKFRKTNIQILSRVGAAREDGDLSTTPFADVSLKDHAKNIV